MKKLILTVLFLLAVTGQAMALSEAAVFLLQDESGASIQDYSLTAGEAVESKGVDVTNNIGFATLIIIENQSGGTGSVDVSVEYSVDGANWYPIYTTDMEGNLTPEGNIVTGLQNVERWIPHTVHLTKYFRYKFSPTADSQITATIIFQRDRRL